MYKQSLKAPLFWQLICVLYLTDHLNSSFSWKNTVFRDIAYTKRIKSEKIGDEVLIKRMLTSHRTRLTSAYGI